MTPTHLISRFFILLLLVSPLSCSKDENILTDSETEEAVEDGNEVEDEEENEMEEESNGDNETDSTACSNPSNFIFNEQNGLVFAEFEEAEFSEDWTLKTDDANATGEGYMLWEGTHHGNQPGNGIATFNIKITNTGVYQFVWYSAVKLGTSGTDHNDTWLRFGDADDFYAQNNAGTSTVYPAGTGKTPNPEGATADGWFKIYRSGNNLDFKWQSSTFDNSAHNVFVQFDTPGTYLMEVSARSSNHGIDKFVLFNDDVSQSDATSASEISVISCD